MGVFEAVKKGFALSGKLLKVVLFFFVLNVVMGLISLPLARPENAGQAGIAVASFALSIVFFLIFIFLQGGALAIVRDLHKTGSAEISKFVEYGKKYYLKILGLLALYILVALLLVLILALLGSGVLAIASNAFTRTIVGVISGLVAILAIVLLLFPIYVIVADDMGVIASLKKGIEIGKSNFWNILGLFMILVLISIVISIVVGFILGLVTVPLPFTITQVIITIVNSAVQSYIPVVMMIALMGYYLGMSKGVKTESPQGPTA